MHTMNESQPTSNNAPNLTPIGREYKKFQEGSQLLFTLPMPTHLRSLLCVCQFYITLDFLNHKLYGNEPTIEGLSVTSVDSKRKYLKNVSQEFVDAIRRMTPDERICYYWIILKQVLRVIGVPNESNGDSLNQDLKYSFNHYNSLKQNKTQIKDLQFEAYIKVGNNLKWKRKSFEYNSKTHSLWITDSPKTPKRQLPHKSKPFIINISSYLARKSKNSSYQAFVLEAWDKRTATQYRSISIGFEFGSAQFLFRNVWESIMYSVVRAIGEFVGESYKNDAAVRGAVGSIQYLHISKISQKYTHTPINNIQLVNQQQKLNKLMPSQQKGKNNSDNSIFKFDNEYQSQQQSDKYEQTNKQVKICKENQKLVDLIYENTLKYHNTKNSKNESKINKKVDISQKQNSISYCNTQINRQNQDWSRNPKLNHSYTGMRKKYFN